MNLLEDCGFSPCVFNGISGTGFEVLCEPTIDLVDDEVLSDTYGRAKRDLDMFRLQEAKAINEKVIALQKIGNIIPDFGIEDDVAYFL